MKLSAILEPMIAAKVPGEVILATVRAYEMEQAGVVEKLEAEAELRREKVRSRVEKWRSKNKSETLRNVTERSDTLQNGSREGVARVEDNYLPTEISGKKERKKEAAPKALLADTEAFKAELVRDAMPEQIEAFVKHRKAKNGQNSAYSARLFRKDAQACGLSVSDAIDTAISRGWLTVKPEYLAGRQHSAPRQPSTASPQRTTSDVLSDIKAGRLEVPNIIDLIKGKTDEPPEHIGPTIDASFERSDRGGAGRADQLYAVSSGRRP